MEHLSIEDPSHQGQPVLGGGVPPQQQQQQLPPQMFTTAAQLLDLTDKKLMVALRDGRKLIGVLRSWDQFGMPLVPPPLPVFAFPHYANYEADETPLVWLRTDPDRPHNTANLVLQNTVERVFAPHPSPPRSDATAAATTPSPDHQPRGGLYADIKRGVFL
ncbi:hypothetical protein BN1723_017014, partial [Verticillium longisporum]